MQAGKLALSKSSQAGKTLEQSRGGGLVVRAVSGSLLSPWMLTKNGIFSSRLAGA
jgi:hypothetical protein